MRVIDRYSGEVLLANVDVAKTFWKRFCGLALRKTFTKNYAMWIEPCSSIHTMWMRVPIDVYFVSADGTVEEHRPGVQPWSVAIPSKGSRSVVEIPNAEVQLEVGRQICLQEKDHE